MGVGMQTICPDDGVICSCDPPGPNCVRDSTRCREIIEQRCDLQRGHDGTHAVKLNPPQLPDMAGPVPRPDGAGLIVAERDRQRSQEGYSGDHDDRYGSGVLARAGATYALHAAGHTNARQYWPFDEEWWKPSAGDPIRDLVKAGALIAAEIDRIQRLAAPPVSALEPQQQKDDEMPFARPDQSGRSTADPRDHHSGDSMQEKK